MFELRWVLRTTSHKLDGPNMVSVKEKVLQSRYKYDKAIYAGLGPHGEHLKEMVWSDWRDVPLVDE